MSKKVYYTTDAKFDDFLWVENEYSLKPPQVAKSCAIDYFHDHDGQTSPWPIDFWLWKENGELIGKFNVDVEYTPIFFVEEDNDDLS